MDSATQAAWWNVWVNAIMAVATLAAAIYALLAYHKQRERDDAEAAERTLRAAKESRELTARIEAVEAEQREREEAGRRAQAELVCIWYDYVNSEGGTIGMKTRSAVIQNASTLPIRNVDIEFFINPGVSRVVHLDAIGPTIRPRVVAVPHDWTHSMDPETKNAIKVAMTFWDARGQTWRREESGDLVLIESAQKVLDAAARDGRSS